MKNTAKLISALSALIIVISIFTACDLNSTGKPEQPTEQDTTTSTTTNRTYETANTVSETTTEETTTEETTTEKVETESLETILNLIKDYPIGTAGSTAKSVDIALRLINFTESTTDIASVKSEYEKFENKLSDVEEEMFEQCLDEIDYMARKLINGTTQTINSYLEYSNEKYNKGNYSMNKYEAVYNIISD